MQNDGSSEDKAFSRAKFLKYGASGVAGVGALVATRQAQAADLLMRLNREMLASPSRKQTLVMGKDMSVDLGMDPARAFEQLDFLVLGNAYNRLVKFPYKADGTLDFTRLLGDLATSWRVSPDARTYTFKLNPHARFASGRPVTSQDVAWSIARLKFVNATPGFLAADVDEIAHPDARTVIIQLTQPDLGFLKRLTSPNFAVIDSKLVSQNGGNASPKAAQLDTAENYLSTQTHGSGPYKMTSYERGQKLVMVINENYWAGHPGVIRQFITQHIPDPNVQVAALERGDLDMTWNLNGYLSLISQLQKQHYVIDQRPDLEWYDILFTADPTQSDIVARETVQLALKYAIDYNGLKHLAPGGNPRMGIAPTFVGGLPESKLLQQDLTKAKQLLKTAGYPNGFSVTISGFKIGGISPSHEQIGIKLAQDWSRIGVNANLNFQEFDAIIGQIRAGATQIALTAWIADYPDPIDYAQYSTPLTSFAKRARWSSTANTVDVNRFPSYPKIVDLAQRMLTATTQSKRLSLFHQLEPLCLTGGAIYPTLVLELVNAAAKDVTGFKYDLLYDWYLPNLGRKGLKA